MDSLGLLLRFAVGFVILASSVGKYAAWSEFGAAVRAYDLLPRWSEQLITAATPVGESVLGVALLLGVNPRVSGALAGLFLLAATGMVASALVRGRRVRCGCYGLAGGDSRVSWNRVVGNVVLIAAVVAAAWAPAGLAPSTSFAPGLTGGLAVLIGALALVLAIHCVLAAAAALRSAARLVVAEGQS